VRGNVVFETLHDFYRTAIDYYIYIIGTHSFFRKNAKMQKKFTAPGRASHRLRIKNKRHGMAVKFSSPCKKRADSGHKAMILKILYK
ncbi:MAG: hypothetical protein Q4F52_09620, partial [Bacteroidaceae bacterium]|nr:hypothetical protein [Bacteroidaceae bacterium]